jgi:hypothetical protein
MAKDRPWPPENEKSGASFPPRGDLVYKGDIALLEEIQEQDFVGVAYGACSTNTFSLSDALGNNGGWCTLTKECQPNCN